MRQAHQIRIALTRGVCRDKKYNAQVDFEGEARQLALFHKTSNWRLERAFGHLSMRRYHVSGQMNFWHWGQKSLTVDFDRNRITDYGMFARSQTTRRYIAGWHYVLRELDLVHKDTGKPIDVFSYMGPYRAFDWTGDPIKYKHLYAKPRNRAQETRLDAFFEIRDGAPWVEKEGDTYWLEGNKIVPGGVDAVDATMSLMRHKWRWYKPVWKEDKSGFDFVFINDDARRRWEAYEKRAKKKA